MNGRIWFEGNPWPDGHEITAFRWTGRVEPPAGICFDFHLETAQYSAEDDDLDEEDDDDATDDWRAKSVWMNYGSCILSSTQWEDGRGFAGGRPDAPFDFLHPERTPFRFDPLPVDLDDARPFAIYLLGHDSVADHEVVIRRSDRDELFSIEWRGAIALTYAGEEEFSYRFVARLDEVPFGGFAFPDGMGWGEAVRFLDRCVRNRPPMTFVEPGRELQP